MKQRIRAGGPGWCTAAIFLCLVVFEPRVRGGDDDSFKNLTAAGVPQGRVSLQAAEKGATAIVFYSSECPISNAYSPTLTQLMDEFKGKPARFVGICVDPDLSDADVAQHARDFDLKVEIARDRTGTIARRLGVKVTPEAVVLDSAGKIRYRGRIDDQFASRGVRRANPSGNELKDALAAVLAGKEVAVPRAEAIGCPLPEVSAPAERPTYSGNVAEILNSHCRECHRKGQVGPFALENYAQARKRASDIASVVESRQMPPWKPAPGFGLPLKDSRALSAADIAALVAWAESDAPEGDPAQTPAPPRYSNDWELGKPDLVLDIGHDFPIPPSGDDIYRCFVIPTSLPRDVAIEAVDFRPGNRRVVHHVLAYVDVSGKARERDAADPGPGYRCFAGPGEPIHADLTGWAPGARPYRLTEGIGRSMPKGADLIVQLHYHPSGKPETDRTQIALYFARKPIKQTLHWRAALNPEMVLPPGKSNIEIKADWKLPVDVEAHGVAPHMHLLGRDMTMSVTFPDGRVQDLLKIDDWDFNWQQMYSFEKPIDLPKGTVLHVVAHFDNSASNPRNPNHPPREVRWGEATTDEMCIGFIGLTKKGQDLTKPGERDDLVEICEKAMQKQIEEYRAKRKRR